MVGRGDDDKVEVAACQQLVVVGIPLRTGLLSSRLHARSVDITNGGDLEVVFLAEVEQVSYVGRPAPTNPNDAREKLLVGSLRAQVRRSSAERSNSRGGVLDKLSTTNRSLRIHVDS